MMGCICTAPRNMGKFVILLLFMLESEFGMVALHKVAFLQGLG